MERVCLIAHAVIHVRVSECESRAQTETGLQSATGQQPPSRPLPRRSLRLAARPRPATAPTTHWSHSRGRSRPPRPPPFVRVRLLSRCCEGARGGLASVLRFRHRRRPPHHSARLVSAAAAAQVTVVDSAAPAHASPSLPPSPLDRSLWQRTCVHVVRCWCWPVTTSDRPVATSAPQPRGRNGPQRKGGETRGAARARRAGWCGSFHTCGSRRALCDALKCACIAQPSERAAAHFHRDRHRRPQRDRQRISGTDD